MAGLLAMPPSASLSASGATGNGLDTSPDAVPVPDSPAPFGALGVDATSDGWMVREAIDGLHSHSPLQAPLTLAQYHELIRAGILTEDDPVELLEGRLVTKMPKNPAHSGATRRLRKTLERVVPAGWFVDSQEPITLSDGEPEPDVMVVRGEAGDYQDRHPAPADLALVVEVSDATLTADRTAKLRSYARAAIPVYWILNLKDRKLEVYSQPSGPTRHPAYQQSQTLGPADKVAVLIAGQEKARLAVQSLLP